MLTRKLPALAAAAALLIAAGTATAQSNLLQKGGVLLKGFGSGASPSAPATSRATGGSLSQGEISGGLIEALKVGTERVVGTLGQTDGYNKRPDVHIPLPDGLKTVQTALSAIGASGMADDLELRLNRAAEAAAPKAKSVFWDAIQKMTIDDARRIYDGPKDAATQYFRGKMSAPLAKEFRPIVDSELASAGAVNSYDQMMGKYKSMPLVPDVKGDLTEHVLQRAIDGIFLYLGREEAAIRENPAARTTDVLKTVFGGT